MPKPSSMTPKRRRATSSSRQTITIAREPMCVADVICEEKHMGSADDHDRARAHVLLLADHVRDAFVAVVRERFRRMLEQAGFLARLRGRDGGRQVDEPFRVDGEA